MRVDTCSDLAAVSIGRPSRRPESCIVGDEPRLPLLPAAGHLVVRPVWSVLSLAGGWGQVWAELASKVSALTKLPLG